STEARTRVVAFLQTMHNLGWREDQTLRVDIRWVGSDPQRIQSETADLLARKPEVNVSGTSVAIAQVCERRPSRSCSLGSPIRSPNVSSRAWRARTRLSFICPIKLSQKGPSVPDSGR